MSLAWSSVKALSIPFGGVSRDVKRVAVGGVEVWRKLPYDAEVEYLESTGTQYIDTGIVPKFNYSAVCRVMRLDAGTGTDAFCTFGVMTGWANKAWLVIHNNNNSLRLLCGSNQGRKDNYAPTFNTWQTYTLANGKLSIDGTQVLSVSASSSSANGNAYLFCGNNTREQGPYGISASRRVSAFAIYDDAGNTLRDFIPVRVGSGANAVGCLFDKLGTGGQNPDGTARNDGLYFRQGSGAFVVGPDAN